MTTRRDFLKSSAGAVGLRIFKRNTNFDNVIVLPLSK
jgi:hypothetical protein